MDPITLAIAIASLLAVIFVITRFKPKIIRLEPEQALLRNRAYLGSTPREVFFDLATIIPALDTYDILDLSIQPLKVELRGQEGVHCKDSIRADVTATFLLKVPRNGHAVTMAAQHVGCSGLSDPDTLRTIFEGKFIEAIKTTFTRLDYEALRIKRDDVRDCIIEVIGKDLNGFHLEDASIEGLEQTPLEQLDPENILDAKGITRITELTAAQHVATNKIRREAEQME
jgi:uncharacterized membrane protein YqiK